MPRPPRRPILCRWAAALLLAAALPLATAAQETPGTRNVMLVHHLPPTPSATVYGDVALDQDAARPFAYVARRAPAAGFDVIDLTDPAQPAVRYAWTLDDAVAHQGPGATDLTYFKHDGRTYLVQAFRFDPGSPDADLGAVVVDVTDLPAAASVREVARLSVPGGLHHLFAYKHSDGRGLLFAAGGGDVLVYDVAGLAAGTAAPVARLTPPEQVPPTASGYHNVFVGYHPDTAQDRFYGAGGGGYQVLDVTDLANPAALTSISSAAVRNGRTIIPTPDGRYAVTATDYRTSPLRIFDLQPGLDGDVSVVRTEVGAWAADWRNFSQQYEVRWPYVFVAALEDGFQVFNLRDPNAPYTIGYYRTYGGPAGTLANPALHGAWDLDVRNTDGLIAVSDLDTGLWLFRLDFFEGWNGRGWGFPNVSRAQDWDGGPDGAP